jgi:acyl carrier protein
MKKNIRNTILKLIVEIGDSTGSKLVDPLTDEVVLLQSGLDSMGFAVLVARLEEELEFDPFTLSDEPIYPRTLGEFINFYEKMAP